MKPLAQNSMLQNRYLIVHPIGKGGMGEVYLAIDQRLGSAVALKRTFFNSDETLGNAFEREAKILARLRHPVLPKVIDHFLENGDQFLVMEHISGDDLAKRLENAQKAFPLSWVMYWADQMLDALNYLHSHEPPIVHRDIKPQNLKLTDDNHIVLLDFGLSKDFDSKSNSLNSASVAGYSPHFASMEQIRGTGTDARSDLYSLSATLYQLLANEAPSDALSRADALIGGKKDSIVAINELNRDVPTAVSDVILKGLAIRQDERYATATEMQKALRRAFNQGEAAAPATTEPRGGLSQSPPPITSAPTERLNAPVAALAPTTEEETRLAPMPTDTVEPRPLTPVEPEPIAAAQAMPEFLPEPVPAVAPVAMAAAATAGIVVPAKAVVATPRPPVQAAPQKVSSKKGLIVGAIVGLFLLGVIGIGGGWYAYTRLAASPDPAATPAVTNQSVQSSVATEPAAPATDAPVQEASSTADPLKPNDGQPATANRTSGPAQAKAPAPKPAARPAAKKTTGATVIEQ